MTISFHRLKGGKGLLESNVFLRYILGFWVQVVPVAALCYLAFDPEDYRLSVKKTAFRCV